MQEKTSEGKRLNRFVVASLVFLFLLGAGLRLFWLDRAPSGTLIDETHFGYIAYSLLKTGKDEHGTPWPLIFKGFGDQKLPAQVYILLPFIQLFGLSVTTIRLPSVVAGCLSILATYFLLKELTKSRRLGLAGAAVMATNPWPFFLSRFGFESNLALLFWLVALNGLIRLEKHWKWAAVAGVFSALTWYTYIAYRPVTLVLLAAYLLMLWFQQKQIRKRLLGIAAVFVVAILPLFTAQTLVANGARFKQIGILSDIGTALVVNEDRSFCGRTLPLIICSIIYNKPVVIMQTLAHRYIHIFGPQYLATTGEDPDRYLTVERYGQFFLLLYPFFAWGLFELLSGKSQLIRGNARWLLALGLFISPLPNILASEPQKVRLSPLLPFMVVCIVLGLSAAMNFLQSISKGRLKKIQKTFLCLFAVIYLGMNIQYFVSFFTIQVTKYDYLYQGNARILVPYIHDEILKGHNMIVQPNFSDPLMYYAFYTKMDPVEYQKQTVLGQLETSGFQHTVGLDHIFVTDEPFLTMACLVRSSATPTIYVSKTKIDDLRPLFEVGSTNGALTFNYAYDISAYAKAMPPCNAN